MVVMVMEAADKEPAAGEKTRLVASALALASSALAKYRPKEKLTVNVVSSLLLRLKPQLPQLLELDCLRKKRPQSSASASASEDLGYIKGRKRKVETERSEK